MYVCVLDEAGTEEPEHHPISVSQGVQNLNTPHLCVFFLTTPYETLCSIK